MIELMYVILYGMYHASYIDVFPSSARGNTSLESAVSLTKSLRWDIQNLGQRLAVAAKEEDLARRGSSKAQSKVQNELELKRIIQDMRKLLGRIEDAVPLINLAITASGVTLSTTLPSTISPSRLLQASTFLTAGDSKYSMSTLNSVQIGPTFTLSTYMLFSGHLRPQNEEDIRQSTWKEVMHKTRVKLIRIPLDTIYDLPLNHSGGSPDDMPLNRKASDTLHVEAEARADEFAYQLVMIEDLDDDRVHTFEDDEVQPGLYDEVEVAGIREAIPIHEISKIFYADTGKILNIGNEGETNSPVLLLKRDLNAIPPRRMMQSFDKEDIPEYENGYHGIIPSKETDEHYMSQSEINAQLKLEHHSSSLAPVRSPSSEPAPLSDPWRIPANLDPEWIAFEVYTETEDSDTESDSGRLPTPKPSNTSRSQSLDPQMTSALSNLHLNGTSTPTSDHSNQLVPTFSPKAATQSTLPPIRTSLSLLETLLRLLSLQQFQQTSHLSIPDELLNFFLSESATTGAAHGDEQERRRLRNETRRRVGFDPYDESPIKQRGEEYQYRGGQSQAGWAEDGSERYGGSPRREQSYGEYSSPPYDEGYDSHRLYTPGHGYLPYFREATPETPPLLLKDRAYSSQSNTPDRASSMPPLPRPASRGTGRYASPETPSGGMGRHNRLGRVRVDDRGKGVGMRGSPLARPGTGITDEGLGTSPAKVDEKREGG